MSTILPPVDKLDIKALSPPERELASISSRLLEHPVLTSCSDKVNQALILPGGYDVLLLIGPSGVGKTTLLKTVLRRGIPPKLNRFSSLFSSAPPGSIPIVSVDARNGNHFDSRWKALLIDILKITNPVLSDVGKLADPENSRWHLCGYSLTKLSIPQLQSLVIESLRARHTRGIFIDEAQHLAALQDYDHNLRPGTDYRRMAESVKELGSVTNTVLVLFGGYSLLGFSRVSEQLSRRSSTIHFRPYSIANSDDAHLFQNLVYTFCSSAPELLPHSELSKLMPILYAGSLGCTGVLRDWLIRAMGEAVFSGKAAVTASILEKTMLDTGRLDNMKRAIDEGLSKYADSLSLKEYIASVASGQPASAPLGTNTPDSRSPAKRRPGKRLPSRDTIHSVA